MRTQNEKKFLVLKVRAIIYTSVSFLTLAILTPQAFQTGWLFLVLTILSAAAVSWNLIDSIMTKWEDDK